MTHVYKELATAEHDLKLFSGMNMNEDKPLYLVGVSGGLAIVNSVTEAMQAHYIHAIGLNGVPYPAST